MTIIKSSQLNRNLAITLFKSYDVLWSIILWSSYV